MRIWCAQTRTPSLAIEDFLGIQVWTGVMFGYWDGCDLGLKDSPGEEAGQTIHLIVGVDMIAIILGMGYPYCALYPPSIGKQTPVIHLAASLVK